MWGLPLCGPCPLTLPTLAGAGFEAALVVFDDVVLVDVADVVVAVELLELVVGTELRVDQQLELAAQGEVPYLA